MAGGKSPRITDCVCTGQGWCQRHQCVKDRVLWLQCQRNQQALDLWEQGTHPSQQPAGGRRIQASRVSLDALRRLSLDLLKIPGRHHEGWRSLASLAEQVVMRARQCAATVPESVEHSGLLESRSERSLRAPKVATSVTHSYEFVATCDPNCVPGLLAFVQSLKDHARITFSLTIIECRTLTEEDRTQIAALGVPVNYIPEEELGRFEFSHGLTEERLRARRLVVWMPPCNVPICYINADTLRGQMAPPGERCPSQCCSTCGGYVVRPKKYHLAVVTCIFNPVRAKRIIQNYWTFRAALGPDVPLYTVELALDDDPFEIPDAIHLRGSREKHLCWQKENLLNLAMLQVPEEFDAIAWIDADVILPQSWYSETCEQLRTHAVLQLFRIARLMGADGAIEKEVQGYFGTRPDIKHPGFAWAIRREVLEGVGLYHEALLGGGDIEIAKGLCSLPTDQTTNTVDLTSRPWIIPQWREWAAIVSNRVAGSAGHLHTDLLHLFHGSWNDRQYTPRHQIHKLANLQHDETYLDEQGLRVVDNPEFTRLMGAHFRNRRDDGGEWRPAIVTSFGPNAGEQCKSWIPHASVIVGVQEKDESAPDWVTRVENDASELRGRRLQRICDMISVGRQHADIVAIINDDIELKTESEYWRVLVRAAAYDLVCVQRLDLPDNVRDRHGVDLFLIPPALRVPDDDRFLMGECGWDWWLPNLAKRQGVNIQFAQQPIALHRRHAVKWDKASFHDSCQWLRESFGIEDHDAMKQQFLTNSRKI